MRVGQKMPKISHTQQSTEQKHKSGSAAREKNANENKGKSESRHPRYAQRDETGVTDANTDKGETGKHETTPQQRKANLWQFLRHSKERRVLDCSDRR